jgi:hypothetical protein
MPNPEVATYIVDLSGSTFPTAQLDALGSGVAEFLSGEALGQPFAERPVAPRGLSIQFVSKNSAQAPRILLVSTKTSRELFDFVKANAANIEMAKRLWQGFVRARNQIWQTKSYALDQAQCIASVIQTLGKQQLLPDSLSIPAELICADANATAVNVNKLNTFVKTPAIPMGSDVEGAIIEGLSNLSTVRDEYPNAKLTLVIASDLVDEENLRLPKRLKNVTVEQACSLAKEDATKIQQRFEDISIVFVGSRNSKVSNELLNKVKPYWDCYLAAQGITKTIEQSDLSGF